MDTARQDQHWIETYKSLVSIATEGFKFSALANGGSAVAILAYLGNIAGKAGALPDMRYPMAAFLAGLFACGVALLFAYLTQLKLLNEMAQNNRIRAPHTLPLWIAISFFLCSLLCFGTGAWQAVSRFPH